MAQADDDALDPRLLPFVEVLAAALVADYRREVATKGSEKSAQPLPSDERTLS